MVAGLNARLSNFTGGNTVEKNPASGKRNKIQRGIKQNWILLRWRAAREWIASDRLRRVRIYIFQGYVLVALVAFASLALLANTTPVFQPDVKITHELQDDLPSWANVIMQAVSWPGYLIQSSILIVLIVGVFAGFGLRWEAIALLFAAVSSTAINALIKGIISRPRPGADLVNVFQILNSYSFPSGHVMFYTTFFGFLLFLSFTLLKRSWPRILVNTIMILLIALVGISRIYLGEHWASDVIGGYLLGSLLLALSVIFYYWGKQRYFVSQPVAPAASQMPVPHEEKQEINEALKNPLLVKKEEVKKEVGEDEKEALNGDHQLDRL
jgi:membrane-associated phospholipid phosphatase